MAFKHCLNIFGEFCLRSNNASTSIMPSFDKISRFYFRLFWRFWYLSAEGLFSIVKRKFFSTFASSFHLLKSGAQVMVAPPALSALPCWLFVWIIRAFEHRIAFVYKYIAAFYLDGKALDNTRLILVVDKSLGLC